MLHHYFQWRDAIMKEDIDIVGYEMYNEKCIKYRYCIKIVQMWPLIPS